MLFPRHEGGQPMNVTASRWVVAYLSTGLSDRSCLPIRRNTQRLRPKYTPLAHEAHDIRITCSAADPDLGAAALDEFDFVLMLKVRGDVNSGGFVPKCLALLLRTDFAALYWFAMRTVPAWPRERKGAVQFQFAGPYFRDMPTCFRRRADGRIFNGLLGSRLHRAWCTEIRQYALCLAHPHAAPHRSGMPAVGSGQSASFRE